MKNQTVIWLNHKHLTVSTLTTQSPVIAIEQRFV